jgi:nicotinamidase-related amidase
VIEPPGSNDGARGILVDDLDSVLVIVDLQPGFLDKLAPGEAGATVDRVRWLTRLASLSGVPIVVTEEEPEHNGATADPVDAVLPNDLTRHRKSSFGLAACPPIMADLERLERGTAVLCGLETDVCVAQSAIGLKEAGWKAVVVRDAVAAPGEAHEQGLMRMAQAGVELVGVKGLGYEWLRTLEKTNALTGFLHEDRPLGITL